MPDNGSGIYSPPGGTKATPNTTIESSKYNAFVDDLVAALTNRLTKDGQTVPTNNLPMGSKKLTGLAAGTANGDSVRYEQAPAGIMTARGDLIRRGASTPERLALGTSGQFLKSDGTDAAWATVTGADIVDDGSGNLTRSTGYFSKTDNFSFVVADRCKRIRFGAVGKTATLLAAATAGAGWNLEMEDAAGGNILASPATDIYANGAGATNSYTFSRGEFGTLVCTGTGYLLSTTKPAASTSVPGVVRLADSAALLAGTANRVPDAAVLIKNIRPLLATLTASNSATLAFTGFDSTKYAAYEFIFDKLVAASACVFNAQFSIDGGSTYLTTGYAHSARLIAIGTTAADIGSNSDAAVRLTSSGGNDISPSYGLSGSIIVKPAAAAYGNSLIGQVHFIRNGGTALESMIGISGTNSTASIMNAIQFFFFTSGGAAVNMVSGNIYVYGIPK